MVWASTSSTTSSSLSSEGAPCDAMGGFKGANEEELMLNSMWSLTGCLLGTMGTRRRLHGEQIYLALTKAFGAAKSHVRRLQLLIACKSAQIDWEHLQAITAYD